MAYDDWYTTTNYVLECAGQTQISSRDNFDNPITGLTRIQQLVRRFVDMCDRALQIKRFNRDSTQEFVINTQVATPANQASYQYTLDASVTMENLRYWSFFNITPQGNSAAPLAQPLYNWEYRDFRRNFPDFTALVVQRPQRWVILPKNASQPQGAVNDMIMFWPLPDNVYQIVYQAQQYAQPLVNDTDPVLWKQQYAVVLWQYAKAMLESQLGEGREQTAMGLAQKFADDYWFWVGGGPQEEKHAVRTGMAIYGPRRGRRTSPYSDTPTQSGS